MDTRAVVLVTLLLMAAAVGCARSAPAPSPAVSSPAAPLVFPQVSDLPPLQVSPAPPGAPIEIVKEGRGRARVFIADEKPSATLQRMVQELRDVVELSTGASLLVVDEMPRADQPAIVIGGLRRVAPGWAPGRPASPRRLRSQDPRRTACSLWAARRSCPPTRAATPATPTANDGTAWAVADFLERFVGVRWYWPTEVGGRCITKTENLSVSPGPLHRPAGLPDAHLLPRALHPAVPLPLV